MDKESVFYRNQAAQQRAIGADASLANVRDRCERAAVAWEAMAERSERTVTLRQNREAAARGDTTPAME